MDDHDAIPVIDAREVAARLAAGQEPGPVLLDVREPHEFVAGRAVGATSAPLSTLGPRLGDIPRDRPLFVICHSGERSAMVTRYLLGNGWSDVANVSGGMIAWEFRGLPTRRGVPEASELEMPAREA